MEEGYAPSAVTVKVASREDDATSLAMAVTTMMMMVVVVIITVTMGVAVV